MGWKALLALLIILGVTGALLFSEKGKEFKERYLDKYLGDVGGYLKILRSKIQEKPINRTLHISITTKLESLNDQEFSIDGKDLRMNMKLESASVAGLPISVKDDKVEFYASSMSGSLAFTAGRIKVYGSAKFIQMNDIKLNPKTGEESIEVFISGEPTYFFLEDVEKENLGLTKTSGILKVNDLPPLALEDDKLTIENFKGSLELEKGEVVLKGYAESVILNGVKLVV